MHDGSTPLAPSRRHQASFSLGNKMLRVGWQICWLLLARYTPPQAHGWRRFLLRTFGARIGDDARIYPDCRIWHPCNLVMGDGSVMGRQVNCYNQGLVEVGARVTISQNVTLCASTHDINDPLFPLILRPIRIEDEAWIAAEAFVGPGIVVGAGAVLGARAVAMRDLSPWTFYTGNPAVKLKARRPLATVGMP